MGEEVAGGVLCRPPGVAAQYRLVVPVRVGHENIVSTCPSSPKCRPWPSAWRSSPRVAPWNRVELLGFSSLKTFSPPVEDLYGQVLRSITRRAKYLVWTFSGGPRIVRAPLTGRPGRYRGPAEEDPAPGIGGALRVLGARAGTIRSGRSWSASTERSARRRGGFWPRATRGRWRAWGRSPTPRPSPSWCAPARAPGVSIPTCAISGWWPASGGVGATTSCTGPASRPLPRWARSTPKSGSASWPPRPRCWPRRSRSSAPGPVGCRRPSWADVSPCTGSSASPVRARAVPTTCAGSRSSRTR